MCVCVCVCVGLPTNKLSTFLEERVNIFLRNSDSGAEVIIRTVSSFDKVLDTRTLMKDRFQVRGAVTSVCFSSGVSMLQFRSFSDILIIFHPPSPLPPPLFSGNRVTSLSSSPTEPRLSLSLKKLMAVKSVSSACTSRSMARTAQLPTLGGSTYHISTASTSSTPNTSGLSSTTKYSSVISSSANRMGQWEIGKMFLVYFVEEMLVADWSNLAKKIFVDS